MTSYSFKLLLIDNMDSFTWNLAQGFMMLGAKTLVVRNDAFSLQEALAFNPTHLVISPGPGRPKDTGISTELINAFKGSIPILGVCLGHQLLAVLNGGEIDECEIPVHGKPDWVHHNDQGLFKGLEQPFKVGRYHSLIVTKAPMGFRVTGQTQSGLIMAIDDPKHAIHGVQFHPESILCPNGMRLLQAFLNCQMPAQAAEGVL